MRVDVPEELIKALDQIKLEHYLYGKGHTTTISFLVDYYHKTESITNVMAQEINKIPGIIQSSFRKVARDFIANLFTESHKPQNEQ